MQGRRFLGKQIAITAVMMAVLLALVVGSITTDSPVQNQFGILAVYLDEFLLLSVVVGCLVWLGRTLQEQENDPPG
jgi:cell division protein FtsX